MAWVSAEEGEGEGAMLLIASDGTSHLAWKRDTILPVNTIFSEQLRKHFPNTLIIPVLGKAWIRSMTLPNQWMLVPFSRQP